MRPVVTHQVAWSVGLSVTLVSPAEMAAPIEMPLELSTQMGPGKHVLDGGPDPAWEGAILKGKERKSIYIALFFGQGGTLKALRHGSHSFTCK